MDEDKAVPPAPESMDEEHRIQLALLGALSEALRTAQAGTRPSEVLERLKEYSGAHFMSEQLLMRLSAYPEYEAHMADHGALMEGLQRLCQRLAAGEPLESRDTHAIRAQLLYHIGNRDRVFLDYYAQWLSQGAGTHPG